MTLDTFLAGVMMGALMTYALLAGADFGGGIWDLVSRGPHAAAQRKAIATAIGPVWEANHVWLIFLIVVLFTCFPRAYLTASIALFWPLHLVLVGIVLRGASFVFRAYGVGSAGARSAWGALFGAARAITPVLLGMCLGAISTGAIRVDGTTVTGEATWAAPFPLITGVLALLLCAYLAAVYLAWESSGLSTEAPSAKVNVAEQFRRRALVTWLVAGVVSVLALIVARTDAPRLWSSLTAMPAVLFIVAGGLLAPASLVALLRRRFHIARVLGGGQVVVLLAGWAAAQWPYLIYPDVTIAGSAAPVATLRLTAITLPIGFGLLLPSLWFLFATFKTGPRSDALRAHEAHEGDG